MTTVIEASPEVGPRPIAPDLRPVVRSGGRHPRARWALLSALLAAEVLAITLRFDTGVLARERGWWARLLAHAGYIQPLALPALAAVVLFWGGRIREEFGRLDIPLGDSGRWRAYLIGHMGAFAAFAAISSLLLTGGPGGPPHAEVWFLCWIIAGLATLFFWVAAVLPPRSWRPLARCAAGALLTGAVIGAFAWMAGRLTLPLWGPLSRSTFRMVSALLWLAREEVVCRPADFVIGTPAFRVRIAPYCSGVEGIGLIWAFLVAYFWLFRRELRFPQALWLLPIGTVVIWMANASRIAMLVLIGSHGSFAVAMGGFHSHSGWLAFNAVGLGLVAVSHRTRFFEATDAGPAAATPGANPTAAYLAPLLALVGVMMITGALSDGFDRLYPLRVLAATFLLWAYRRGYPDLRRTWSWTAAAIGVAAFAIWMALEPAGGAASPLASGLARLPIGWAAFWLISRVVGSVVVVPLAEELAFRGFLARRLIAADFTDVPPGRFSWPSFLISSALFGALHGRWLAGTLAGLLYALALYRRRELADAIVAHATTNALIAAYVLSTGAWSLWG